MRTFTSGTALAFLFSCSEAMATHACWIENVQRDGDILRFRMRSEYEFAVRLIYRADGTSKGVAKAEDGSFELLEGERASISTLPHDGCSATAKKQDGKLGLMIETTTCFPIAEIGCQHSASFVVDN